MVESLEDLIGKVYGIARDLYEEYCFINISTLSLVAYVLIKIIKLIRDNKLSLFFSRVNDIIYFITSSHKLCILHYILNHPLHR